MYVSGSGCVSCACACMCALSASRNNKAKAATILVVVVDKQLTHEAVPPEGARPLFELGHDVVEGVSRLRALVVHEAFVHQGESRLSLSSSLFEEGRGESVGCV